MIEIVSFYNLATPIYLFFISCNHIILILHFSGDSVISDLRKLKDAILTGDRTCVSELDAKYKTIIAPLTLTITNPSYSNLQTDGLAETLAPTDIPFSKVRPVKTTGNGDCLFNATSLYLKG